MLTDHRTNCTDGDMGKQEVRWISVVQGNGALNV